MLTTRQVAERLGVSPRRVLALAKDRRVAPAMIAGRSKLWQASDVERLRPRAVGGAGHRK